MKEVSKLLCSTHYNNSDKKVTPRRRFFSHQKPGVSRCLTLLLIILVFVEKGQSFAPFSYAPLNQPAIVLHGQTLGIEFKLITTRGGYVWSDTKLCRRVHILILFWYNRIEKISLANRLEFFANTFSCSTNILVSYMSWGDICYTIT